MRRLLSIGLIVSSVFLLAQCRKSNSCTNELKGLKKLSYGDSIFCLKNYDYTISPSNGKSGTYTAFPHNLLIDKKTGKITVSLKGTDGESQTGMWYRIVFKAAHGNQTDTTYILISGITYLDRFYRLSQHDSILLPIYNGDPANAIPPGNFNLAHDDKLAVNPTNGQINLKECMRRGFFNGSSSFNGSWRMATVKYAVSDRSNNMVNQIDIVLYYYSTMNHVPSNVSELMQAHQQMTVGMRALPAIPSTTGAIDNNLPSSLSLAKPRPPCVIIVGN